MSNIIKLLVIIFVIPVHSFAQGNWSWQNPLPQGDILSNIFPINKNEVILTSPSTILKSTNLGEKWEIQNIEQGGILRPIFFTSMETGYRLEEEVYEFSTIFKTTNGGSSWTSLLGDVQDSFRDLYFHNDNVGFVIGASGNVYKTNDGGNDWSITHLVPEDHLREINFSNDSVGWIKQWQKNNIFLTTDAGISWHKVPIQHYSGDVFFINDSVGYNCTGWSIYTTYDCGAAWIEILYNNKIGYFNKVFVNHHTIWAITNDGYVVSSKDEGNNWKITKLNDGDFLNINFYDELTGWIVGRGGIILVTTDGGENWVQLSEGTQSNLVEIVFIDDKCGWVTGYDYSTSAGCYYGEVLRTKDGGENWTVKLQKYGFYFVGIDFVNSETGWVVGQNGTILKTSDGGDNWVELNSGVAETLTAIDFIDENYGVAVGDHKTILYSSDGGDTWEKQTDYTENHNVKSVQMITPNLVYAVVGNEAPHAHYGYVLKTIDGGKNWDEINQNWSPLLDLFFLDSLTGWICEAHAYKTTDGGISWVSQSTSANSIHFVDANNGWAVSGSRNYAFTTNGGDTWHEKITLGTFPTDLFFTSKNNGWIIGLSGMILKYTDINSANSSDQGGETINNSFILYNNYPNPFNINTVIPFKLNSNAYVILEVYDISGKLVRRLLNNYYIKGNYKTEWDGTGNNNKKVASGVYFTKLSVERNISLKKMFLLK